MQVRLDQVVHFFVEQLVLLALPLKFADCPVLSSQLQITSNSARLFFLVNVEVLTDLCEVQAPIANAHVVQDGALDRYLLLL